MKKQCSTTALTLGTLGTLGIIGALGACSSDASLATAPAAAEHYTATAAANGVSNPNTPVTALVTISVGGSLLYRESGPGNAGNGNDDLGTCTTGGRWYNPQNKKTSANPSPHCLSISAAQIFTITFSEVANYVLATSGNVNLNFAPAAGCDPLTDPLGCGRAIQYKKNQNVTGGFGILTATETEHGSGLWTIDLGAANQPFATTNNNILPSGTAIIACNTTYGCHPGLMTW
jgi:hypothetical protein